MIKRMPFILEVSAMVLFLVDMGLMIYTVFTHNISAGVPFLLAFIAMILIAIAHYLRHGRL